jgi:hypothetical protein
MGYIKFPYILLIMTLSMAAIAAPVRGKYSNGKLGYELNLPSGVVCMRSEPDHGCGFDVSLRFSESEWKIDSLPSRYMWVSGEMNTGGENTLERAVQRAVMVGTVGRAGAVVLGRRSYMIGGLPAAEIDISYNAEECEALEKIRILYRERKGAPNVIYTFGLHTPRNNENEDVRLFHEFISGFRVK